jgi:hypothetical protein
MHLFGHHLRYYKGIVTQSTKSIEILESTNQQTLDLSKYLKHEKLSIRQPITLWTPWLPRTHYKSSD